MSETKTRDLNSVRYTVVFATVVCVVCAALIAASPTTNCTSRPQEIPA